jgi:hypothetical protein
VAARAGKEFPKSNDCTQPFPHRVTENRLIPVSWILNAVGNIHVSHRAFEVTDIAAGSIMFGQAIEGSDLEMPGQCLETTPTTPTRGAVLDAASGRNTNFRPHAGRNEEKGGKGEDQHLLDHATTLLPWIQTCLLWHVMDKLQNAFSVPKNSFCLLLCRVPGHFCMSAWQRQSVHEESYLNPMFGELAAIYRLFSRSGCPFGVRGTCNRRKRHASHANNATRFRQLVRAQPPCVVQVLRPCGPKD